MKFTSRTKFFLFAAVVAIMLVVKSNSTNNIIQSDEFEIAQEFILKSKDIQNSIGRVEGFGSFASGDLNSPEGNSYLVLKVIGESDAVKVGVILTREKYGSWKVTELKFLKSYSLPWI